MKLLAREGTATALLIQFFAFLRWQVVPTEDVVFFSSWIGANAPHSPVRPGRTNASVPPGAYHPPAYDPAGTLSMKLLLQCTSKGGGGLALRPHELTACDRD